MFQELISGASLGPKDGQNFEHGWQNDYFEAYLITNVGRVRTHNEDCAVLCAPSDPQKLEDHGILLAVADGMGGASAGEVASHMALEKLVEQYYQGDADQEIPSSLREAVQNANLKIFEYANDHPECQGMGTTMSVLVLKDNWAYIAQVGDSRVYLHRHGLGMRQLTRDHSYVAKQVRKGELSPEEAENHEMKNLITRSVGIKEKVKVDLFHLELQENDTFLICSDGLCGLVGDDVLSDVIKIRGVRTKTFTAVNKALEAGGHDNVSVICVQVHALAAKFPAPQPTIFKPNLQAHAAPAAQAPPTPKPEVAAAKISDVGEASPFEGLDNLDDDFESFDSIHIDLESEHGVEEEEERPKRGSGAYAVAEAAKAEKAPLILWITLGLGGLLIVAALLWIFLGSSGQPGTGLNPTPAVAPGNQAEPQDSALHPAVRLLEAGADYSKAMAEAKSLVRQNENAANLGAIEDLRKRFVARVEVLLNKATYAPADHDEAAELVSQALIVDEHPDIQELHVKVQQEIAAHKFMLLDVTEGTATFSINNPYYPSKQERVKEGDVLQERFKVELLTPQRVRLSDTKISGPAGQRMLTAQIRMPVSME